MAEVMRHTKASPSCITTAAKSACCGQVLFISMFHVCLKRYITTLFKENHSSEYNKTLSIDINKMNIINSYKLIHEEINMNFLPLFAHTYYHISVVVYYLIPVTKHIWRQTFPNKTVVFYYRLRMRKGGTVNGQARHTILLTAAGSHAVSTRSMVTESHCSLKMVNLRLSSRSTVWYAPILMYWFSSTFLPFTLEYFSHQQSTQPTNGMNINHNFYSFSS